MKNQDRLNKMCPTAGDVNLGDKLNQIITYLNRVNDTMDGVLAKLDADSGTETNYAALWGTSGSEANCCPGDVDTLD